MNRAAKPVTPKPQNLDDPKQWPGIAWLATLPR